MKLFQAYYILIFLTLRVASQEHAYYAKKGCRYRCGNVRIPYPFGIGQKCAINEWYVVDCNSSTPYLPAVKNYEIIEISLNDQTIIINTPKPTFSDCQNPVTTNNITTQTNTIDLGTSPFLLSPPHNIFVFEGCGNAVLMDRWSTVLTGCSTNCLHDITLSDNRSNSCFGIGGCCQNTIPSRYLNSYNISLIIESDLKQGGNRGCGTAFVMEKRAYINRSQSSISSGLEFDTFVPISLLWTLSEIDYDGVTCCRHAVFRQNLKVDLGNGTSIDSWKCGNLYDDYIGNPYFEDGCEHIRNILNGTNYCFVNTTYNPDGSVYQRKFYCPESSTGYDHSYKPRKSLLGVILGM
uniref:wall-associated receptor kinase-like 8 n=1 Tax=Erigeron canadensis TaxID=72917 RepID=UPI001CB91F3E|nr:wall-associated receptor kinase-like 8 [Erigeron canadensis]